MKKGNLNSMENLKLVSSNKNKLKEFQRFGLLEIAVEEGRDLKEVDSDEESVIIYKALSAGKNRIVEDTSLSIENADVGVNVRWLIDNLKQYHGRKAIWKVYLGLNDGENIQLFKGEVEGVIDAKTEIKGFGFDSIFKPLGSSLTLYELEEAGLKDDFSARKNAVQMLKNNQTTATFTIKDIPKWVGAYQAD